MTVTDLDLLRQYATDGSQAAFTALVQRHVNLVYSAALRQIRSPHLAEEITQSVFADLARDATKLKPDTILTAWLYQVAAAPPSMPSARNPVASYVNKSPWR